MAPLVLERLPGVAAFAILFIFVLLAALPWPDAALKLCALGLHLALDALDGLSLALLPRLGRSFGPVRPPLFMLAAARMLLTMFVGLIGGWDMAALIAAGAVQIIVFGVTLYGLWIEPFRLEVTRETLESPLLDPSLPAVRVLHLADLHVERPTRRERRVAQLIDELAPDVIVFSGDFVNLTYHTDPMTIASTRELISRWRAASGVFAISGSPVVENPDVVAQIVDGTGVCWLRDEVVTLEVHGQRLAIFGVTCAHNTPDDTARLHALLDADPHNDSFRLLLFHSPDIAPEAARSGIDLYLCGHTHGGQIRLPFYGALITSSSLGKQYEMGRYRVEGMALYVSRGIGMEGGSAPRARLFCRPEITLWTLTGA